VHYLQHNKYNVTLSRINKNSTIVSKNVSNLFIIKKKGSIIYSQYWINSYNFLNPGPGTINNKYCLYHTFLVNRSTTGTTWKKVIPTSVLQNHFFFFLKVFRDFFHAKFKIRYIEKTFFTRLKKFEISGHCTPSIK
jgi:hypothetical protein